MAASKPRRLRCSVKNYDWGRSGEESTVGRIFSRNSKVEIEAGKPYAELWMGTHESEPSFVVSGGTKAVTLQSWIAENPSVLGEEVAAKWGTDLPFLFKVLSVEKALSIQTHPDKELAEALHEAHPGVYKDANHKPEMVLAITEFKALYGFVSVEELKDVIARVPEITELIGDEYAIKVLNINVQYGNEEVKALLKSIFTKLMSVSKEEVSELVSKLIRRLNMENKGFPEILQGTPLNPYASRYTPPFDEFEVDRCLLPPGESVAFPASPGPSIFVVVAGEGIMASGGDEVIGEGDVFFVPALAEMTLSASTPGYLELYRAGVNGMFFVKP